MLPAGHLAPLEGLLRGKVIILSDLVERHDPRSVAGGAFLTTEVRKVPAT